MFITHHHSTILMPSCHLVRFLMIWSEDLVRLTRGALPAIMSLYGSLLTNRVLQASCARYIWVSGRAEPSRNTKLRPSGLRRNTPGVAIATFRKVGNFERGLPVGL